MKKFWKIIGLAVLAFIVGITCFCVRQTYLDHKNRMSDTHAFQDYKIEWKDKNIELEIRRKLKKYNEDIYLSDVYGISYLSLEGKGICSIEDLSIFKNLVSLTLKDTSVESLSPLADLHRLKEVIILNGGQPVIDSLTNLTNLKRLVIYDSDVHNIEAVQELKNLTEFFMSKCKVKNISALGDLKNLKSVAIQDCNIEDISALQKMDLHDLTLEGTKVKSIPILSKNIEELWLDNNQIDDISSLKDLKNLYRLMLNNNKIRNIEPLRHLKKLVDLEIQDNYVQDIEPISSLPKLMDLDVRGNPIKDFSCIKLPALEYVALSGEVKGEDLGFLSKSRGLKSLTIVNTDLSKIINPIPALQSLETVRIDSCQMKTSDIFMNLTNLNSLAIVDTDLSKIINPIPALQSLETVTINRCQLKTLDLFTNLNNLSTLDVRDNEIDDITALNKIKILERLYLEGNQINVDDIPEELRDSQRTTIDILQDDFFKSFHSKDIAVPQ